MKQLNPSDQHLIQANLNRLLRGIATHHVVTVRQAWKDLLNSPQSFVPSIQEKLSSDTWRDEPRGPSKLYLGVLLALLHELDPAAFKAETDRLLGQRLHPLHRRTVELVSRRHGDQIIGKVADRVPVYISSEIRDRAVVFKCLERWSKTPDLAISTVSRVDVIAARPEMDYLGKYNLLYDGIVLTWPNRPPHLLARWWRRTQTELTFYHEVGHHYFQHQEGGQIEEQEREANRYRLLMYRNAHPIQFGAAKIILWPARILLRRLNRQPRS